MNAFNTPVQPTTFTTSGTQQVMWNNAVFPGATYNIQGHPYTYDTATQKYTSIEKPHIVLTAEMVANLNSGGALLDWVGEKISYLDQVKNRTIERAHHFGEPRPGDRWKDGNGSRFTYTPNSDWLDGEVDKICELGRKLLAAA